MHDEDTDQGTDLTSEEVKTTKTEGEEETDIQENWETDQISYGRKLQGNFRSFSEPCMMGIDEAGRGPALGAMVYGACYAPITKLAPLKALGVNDSKKLTESQRASLFKIIKKCDYIGWVVDSISPQELSSRMLRSSRESLNVISHNSAIGLVQSALNKGINVAELYVDTVGDAEVYRSKLQNIFPKTKVTVTSKADALFPIVSAASICAKVTRDTELSTWLFTETDIDCHREFGSGYPGDDVTKTWLRDHIDPVFGLPSIVRFSWGTTVKLLKERCKNVVWGDENDDDDADSGSGSSSGARMQQQRMGSFFTRIKPNDGITARAAGVRLDERTPVMRRNHMSVVTSMPLRGEAKGKSAQGINNNNNHNNHNRNINMSRDDQEMNDSSTLGQGLWDCGQ